MKIIDITEDTNHAAADRLLGFSMRETGGVNPVVVTLRKETVSGQVLMEISLAASESASLFLPRSVASENGVYVQTTGTGAISGVLYYD